MRIFKDNLSTFTDWFAWTMALLASVFFGVFLFEKDIPELILNKSPELLWFVLLVLLSMTGTIVSLWRRIPGGILLLAGGTGLILYFYFLSEWKDIPLMIVFGLPYILPGFLFLLVKNRQTE
jgi:hypothetical protein